MEQKSEIPSEMKIKFLEDQFNELCLYLRKLLQTAPTLEEAQEIVIIKHEIERRLADKLRLVKDFEILKNIQPSEDI